MKTFANMMTLPIIITHWLPYKKLQIALHAWVNNTHWFSTPFFHANEESRFAQMTAKCYGSKSSSIC
jgi:hypothetical protein